MGWLRALDPSYAKEIDSVWIRSLCTMNSVAHLSSNLADKLEQELRVYQGAAQNFTVDRADIPDFTTKVLHWWACNHSKIPN